MAAVLSRNKSDTEKLAIFTDECKKMHITVKGPDVNESYADFGVNTHGDIRFGIAALKGIGENVAAEILAARNKGGIFSSIFDFIERVNPSVLNRRILDTLAMAGAFDCFSNEIQREDFFVETPKGTTFSDELVRYGQLFHQDKQTKGMSLFGDDDPEMTISGRPAIVHAVRWVDAVRLEKEREIVGTYHSANPLDPYFMELHFCTTSMREFAEQDPVEGKEIALGGMVVSFTERPAKNGGKYGILKVQDYTGASEFMLFGRDFTDFHNFGVATTPIYIKGVYARRFQNNDLRFNIKSIHLLEEMKGKLIHGIRITVPLNSLNETLTGVLLEHINTSTDVHKDSLTIRVIDPVTNRLISLDSQIKLPVNKELIEKLEDLEVEFALER